METRTLQQFSRCGQWTTRDYTPRLQSRLLELGGNVQGGNIDLWSHQSRPASGFDVRNAKAATSIVAKRPTTIVWRIVPHQSKSMRLGDALTWPGRQHAPVLRLPGHFVITPHAIRSPALPAGSDFMSSGLA
jgi:hypothetical protein